MRELCELYSSYIKKHYLGIVKFHSKRLQEEQLKHVLWMLEEIPKMYDQSIDDRYDGKIHRWLGFVQGWMWSVGLMSINELRESVKKARI
jgi:hypothetical protein